MLILDGKATAAETRASLKEEVASLLPRAGRAPGLAVILAGDDPASQVYVRNKEKAALEVGINARTLASGRHGIAKGTGRRYCRTQRRRRSGRHSAATAFAARPGRRQLHRAHQPGKGRGRPHPPQSGVIGTRTARPSALHARRRHAPAGSLPYLHQRQKGRGRGPQQPGRPPGWLCCSEPGAATPP